MEDDNALVRRALEEGRTHRSGLNVSVRCPFPECSSKRKPSLSVHDDGPWKCWRCSRVGFLSERSREQAPHRRDRLREEDQKSDYALSIFERCRDISPNDPVDLYLRSRKILPLGSIWWPADLRIGWLKHPCGRFTHAMVAAVRNVAGVITGVHRTFLDDRGFKFDAEPNKMSLGPNRGCAVRLADGLERLCIGEGIETAMRAASKLQDVTPWSSLTAGGMSALELPRETREIWVAPDMDDHGRNKLDDFSRNAVVARTLHRTHANQLPDDAFVFGCVGAEAAFHLIRRANARGVITHLLPSYHKDHAE